MQVKRVVMFFSGRLFPSETGTARVVADMARLLNAQEGVQLTLVVLDGQMSAADEELCRSVSWKFVRLRPASRWSSCGILNAAARRLGADVHAAFFRALAIRRQMTEICADADVVLVNSTVWHPILPQVMRRQKAVVVTHDILFQRRASFEGRRRTAGRFLAALRTKLELAVLRSFRRVAVFAEYERDLLEKAGMPSDRIACIGLPIVCERQVSARKKDWDFVLIGAGCRQNEEAAACFFRRVVPLLDGRRVSLAVAGGLCESAFWQRRLPENVNVVRLGFVPNLSEVCARSRIGVSMPIHGSGVKVKTVECIEAGLPMVLTDCGEEGVPTTPDGSVNVDCVSDEDVRAKILRWLDDPGFATEAGLRQSEAVRAAFSPERTLKGLLS